MAGVVADTKNPQGAVMFQRKVVIAGLNGSGKNTVQGLERSKHMSFRMSGKEYPLYKHTASSGKTYLETIQGRAGRGEFVFVFIALKNELGLWVRESLWLPHEMREFIQNNS